MGTITIIAIILALSLGAAVAACHHQTTKRRG